MVVRNEKHEFLIIKRGIVDEDELAGLWGFPAIKKESNESDVNAVHRVAVLKLGTQVNIGEKIGELTEQRRDYILRLVDYEVTIIDGIPSVPQPGSNYLAFMFTNDSSMLLPAAKHGSQCTRIFLERNNQDWNL